MINTDFFKQNKVSRYQFGWRLKEVVWGQRWWEYYLQMVALGCTRAITTDEVLSAFRIQIIPFYITELCVQGFFFTWILEQALSLLYWIKRTPSMSREIEGTEPVWV